MKISVEISYYPLNESYIPPIKGFIERLSTYNEITCKTNSMSTRIFGEFDVVMEILTREIKKSFALPHSVFVMKVINADLED